MTVKDIVLVVDTNIKPSIRKIHMVNGEVTYEKLSYLDSEELQVIDITVCDNQLIISV